MTTQTTTDLLDDARDLVNHSDLDETGIRTLNRKARAAGEALKRLQMCADCRVVDMIENKDETNIFQVKR